MKRILSFCLCLFLLVGAWTVPAYADSLNSQSRSVVIADQFFRTSCGDNDFLSRSERRMYVQAMMFVALSDNPEEAAQLIYNYTTVEHMGNNVAQCMRAASDFSVFLAKQYVAVNDRTKLVNLLYTTLLHPINASTYYADELKARNAMIASLQAHKLDTVDFNASTYTFDDMTNTVDPVNTIIKKGMQGMRAYFRARIASQNLFGFTEEVLGFYQNNGRMEMYVKESDVLANYLVMAHGTKMYSKYLTDVNVELANITPKTIRPILDGFQKIANYYNSHIATGTEYQYVVGSMANDGSDVVSLNSECKRLLWFFDSLQYNLVGGEAGDTGACDRKRLCEADKDRDLCSFSTGETVNDQNINDLDD